MAKWLKHLTVDQKSQVRIPLIASKVKCFFTPPPLGRPASAGGNNQHLYLYIKANQNNLCDVLI